MLKKPGLEELVRELERDYARWEQVYMAGSKDPFWPDGVIQLELRPDAPGEPETGEAEQAAQSVLLRYLALRLAGDAAADALLMHPAAAKGLPAYDAVVPLRFAPLRAPERFDERAGLVVRLAPNIARVNAALAVTVPTGQGKRLIEQIEVM